jgi:hypothetical protein
VADQSIKHYSQDRLVFLDLPILPVVDRGNSFDRTPDLMDGSNDRIGSISRHLMTAFQDNDLFAAAGEMDVLNLQFVNPEIISLSSLLIVK